MWRIVLLAGLVPALSTSMVPAQAEVAPRQVLVELRKEGGFAGLNDRVTVYGNGCVRLSRRTGPTVGKCLTAKEKRRLRGHLGHLKLGRSQRAPQGADFIKYTLAYGKRRAGVYDLPPTWRPVVRELDKIMEKYWAPD
ncbi:hypothetical protein [Nonomuraea candida]|uniref:hypothetical protein n=1 Tax=Nonomuraea candida TaxID=359159 RepID=UPI0005B79187|nr:hypothetical protein [Nonomuraea candida]